MDQTEFKRPKYNLLNGRFLKGNEPHNKGKSWDEWMPKKAQRKIRKNLDKIRRGNPNLPGANKKKVVCINSEGEWALYNSATAASEILSLDRANICSCCRGKVKHCGGYRWFYWDDDTWTKLIKRD